MLIEGLAHLLRWLWLWQIHWIHKGRASGMGKFFIMDYCTLVRMVSFIQLEFFLNLPLSTGISRYTDSFLTQESPQLDPFQVVSDQVVSWEWSHLFRICLWIVLSLVSQSQIFPSWVPAFLVSTSPSTFPLWNLFFVFFENPAHFFFFTNWFSHHLFKGKCSCK